MNKFIFIVIFILILGLTWILIFPYKTITHTVTAKDYFPIKPNTVFVYQGYGNEFASYIRTTEYTNCTKQQQRINNGGTEIANVYEYTDCGVKLIFTKNEYYNRENFLYAEPNRDEYLIKNPIKNGTSWTLPDGSIRSITNTNATVTTDLKTYTCALEVTTIAGANKTQDYYVSDVGLIKSVYYLEGGYTVTSSLKEIKTNISNGL